MATGGGRRPAQRSGGSAQRFGSAAQRSGSAAQRSGSAAQRPPARTPGPARRPALGPPPGRYVVGPLGWAARAAAASALLAALIAAVGGFLPYLTVGAVEVRPPVAAALAGLVVPVVIGAAAVVVLRGRLPRLGLGVLGGVGALGPGLLLLAGYQFQAEGRHRAIEVFAGRRLVTSEIGVGPGAWLALVAAALLVATLVLTLVAWPRTTMEDAGDFDRQRPRALVGATVAALTGILAVVAPQLSAPPLVQTGPSGLVTTTPVPADVALPERLALDLLGGWVLAAAILLAALLGATVRPRLAAVGAWAGLAAWFAGTGLVAAAEAARRDDIGLGTGGWLQLLSALLFAGLAAWAARAGLGSGHSVAPAEPVAVGGRGLGGPASEEPTEGTPQR